MSQILAKASYLISYLGTGVVLAFYMLMWGSASSAQIVGGFLSSLALILLLEIFAGKLSPPPLSGLRRFLQENLSNVPHRNWLWVFFFWEGINAYFYLEVPGIFFIPPLFLLLLGGYSSYSLLRCRPPQSLWLRFSVWLIIVAMSVIGSIGWSLLAKPKSFY